MEPEVWASEFPTLFGPDAKIPTLVLHGKKGWNKHTQQPAHDDDDDDESRQEELDDNDDSIVTQPPNTQPPCEQATVPTPKFPETVHFSEITSSWIPPNDLMRVSNVLQNNNYCLSPELISYQKSCRGVHHAKYMLLVETTGALVVVVSTANMTAGRTIDASWMQRFPPLTQTLTTTTNKNDFGVVLAHFLQHQMLSTRAHQITLTAFLQTYLGWKSLRDLLNLYSFENAQVHLMPVVPGVFPLQTTQKETTVLFGQQRMAQVLQQLTQGTNPRLPKHFLSDQDRLICQPTSLGAEWTVEQMAAMVQTYLGQPIGQRPQVAFLKRLDIVWPTDYYVQQVQAATHEETITTLAFPTDDDDTSHASSQVGGSGFLFLSSETFNRIHIDCLSQMVLWEPSVPNQQNVTLVPHIKSISRVFHGNDYRIRKDHGIPKCEELFSWFLLTSACLSRGAQGVCMDNKGMHYANFELGVLFSSRLDSEKRLYGWKPSQCVCKNKSTRVIHLPIPYSVRPPRYQEEEDEVEFCETPYFHEVTPGSVAVGNMRLTPYGVAMAKRLLKKES